MNPEETTFDKAYYCINCSFHLKSSVEQKLHYKSDFHRYNLKRRLVNLLPISIEQYEQINTVSNITLAQALQKYNCELCSQTYLQHLQSNKHKQTMKQNKYQSQQPKEKEIQFYKLVTMDDQRICLFCNKQEDTIELNLEHMQKEHSFFLYEQQQLIDLPGIIKYLREKIQIGLLCIFCENNKAKQFKTGEAVQMHMIKKGHCFMQTELIAEYQEFYNFQAVTPLDLIEFTSNDESSQFEVIDEENIDKEWENIDEDEQNNEKQENQQEETTINANIENFDKRESFIMAMNRKKFGSKSLFYKKLILIQQLHYSNSKNKLLSSGELLLSQAVKKMQVLNFTFNSSLVLDTGPLEFIINNIFAKFLDKDPDFQVFLLRLQKVLFQV